MINGIGNITYLCAAVDKASRKIPTTINLGNSVIKASLLLNVNFFCRANAIGVVATYDSVTEIGILKPTQAESAYPKKT